MKKTYLFSTICLFVVSSILFANPTQMNQSDKLQLPSIFGENMVIQQNDSVAFFGKAGSSQKVIIGTSWGEVDSTYVNENGYWKLKIQTPEASFHPQTVKVSTNTDIVLLSNVLIGEVWLCSGQSNMAFRLKNDHNGAKEIANADNLPLRLFVIPSITSPKPKENIENTHWELCTSATLENFSAVAYYYGKSISASLPNTPIGLISSAYGSATIEAFMSKKALLSKTFLEDHYYNYTSTKKSKNPTWCYNAMILPLQPYTIKGVVWYQGESNCVRASHYYEALEIMINSYRAGFENEEMPFYIVQLPPYNYRSFQQEEGDEFSAAKVREAQLQISKNIENTGLVVTTDIGEVDNIHPTNKKPVGERLADLALNQSYGQKDRVFSGPKYKSYSIEGNSIRLTFDFVENGIKDIDEEELIWFVIAGCDKKFYKGHAIIDGSDILISSPFVKNPISVRFAWSNIAIPNFFNVEGLPASPFKVDDWPIVTYDVGINSWSSLPKY